MLRHLVSDAHPPTEAHENAPFATGLAALPPLLETMPAEVVGNACSLLQVLGTLPPSADRTALASAVADSLEACRASAAPAVRASAEQAQKNLASLS